MDKPTPSKRISLNKNGTRKITFPFSPNTVMIGSEETDPKTGEKSWKEYPVRHHDRHDDKDNPFVHPDTVRNVANRHQRIKANLPSKKRKVAA